MSGCSLVEWLVWPNDNPRGSIGLGAWVWSWCMVDIAKCNPWPYGSVGLGCAFGKTPSRPIGKLVWPNEMHGSPWGSGSVCTLSACFVWANATHGAPSETFLHESLLGLLSLPALCRAADIPVPLREGA